MFCSAYYFDYLDWLSYVGTCLTVFCLGGIMGLLWGMKP